MSNALHNMSGFWKIDIICVFLCFKWSLEPVLRSMSCGREGDCDIVEGSYCNLDTNLCTCKPDYPVTDTRHCYKGKLPRLDVHTSPRLLPSLVRSMGSMGFTSDLAILAWQEREEAESFGNLFYGKVALLGEQQWIRKLQSSIKKVSLSLSS